MSNILILESDPYWREVLSETFKTSDHIAFFPDINTLDEAIKTIHYDVVILDAQIEANESLPLLRHLRQALPYTPVIVTSATEKSELIVNTIKLGAFDFIAKPFTSEKIRLVVQNALENRKLRNEIDYLRRQQDIIYDFNKIIAESPITKELIETLRKFTKTDSTILMCGETGTGKSFFSGAIHYNSPRKTRPFVKINCANIPENLLESELFGHEKGAFTGASKLRIGRFEQANGGTLFLDEIGEMSLNLQAKLLRVLEEKAFERLGGNRTILADARLIAATNRRLEDLVASGKFREDLYYRINILSIIVPPLRERRQDICPLAHSLLRKITRSINKQIVDFSPQVIEWIQDYSWPGNIRQMENTILRAVILEEDHVIQKKNILIPEETASLQNQRQTAPSDSVTVYERDLILKTLEENLWIQKDAARVLGMSSRVLNYKIKKYQITHPRWRKNK